MCKHGWNVEKSGPCADCEHIKGFNAARAMRLAAQERNRKIGIIAAGLFRFEIDTTTGELKYREGGA